jgi:cytochrome c oxidase subunit 2
MNEWLRRILFLPPQGSSVARGIDTLHYVVITTAMLGATLVFAVAIAFLVRFRRRPGDALTPRVRMPRTLEIVLIVGTLTLFLVFWVVGYRQYVAVRTPPRGALDVYVTGKQWMWKFAYPNGRSSVGVLAVPVGRPVRLVLTSRDVIHSFFVPAFRIKQDAVPGRYVSTWFEATEPGTYDIFCAEYCGVSHSRMRAAVVALAPSEYAAWLDRSTATDDDAVDGAIGAAGGDLAEAGRRVAVRRACFACHTVDGQRHIGPTWRGLFGSRVTLADGRTIVADESYLTRSMMDPQSEIVASFNPVMPTYLGVLEAPEAAALVEYIRTLRGPARPSVILPSVPTDAIVPADATVVGAGAATNDLQSIEPTQTGALPSAAVVPSIDGGAIATDASVAHPG